MSVERFGQWSLFWSYFIIFQHVANLGMHMSVKYFFAHQQKSTDLAILIQSSLRLRLGFSLIFSFALGLFLFLFPRSESHLFQLPIYLTTLFAIFFYTFSEFHKSAFEGLHKLRSTFQITAIEAVISFGMIFLFYAYFKSFESIIFGYGVAYLISSIYGIFTLIKKSGVSLFSKNKLSQGSLPSKILRYSFATFLLSICASLAMEVDTLMLNYLTSDYETGIYGAAKQLLRYLPHISIAIAMGTLPAFAIVNEQNKKNLRNKFQYVFGLNLGVFIFIAISILAVGGYLLPWALGERFRPSILPLCTLLPYIVFHAVITLTGNLINYWGLVRVLIFNQLIFFALNILLNFVLIPKYGAAGAGISTSLSIIPYLIINLYWVWKKLYR